MLTYVIIGFMVWLAVYCLIDRICTAVEQSALYKAYASYLAHGINVSVEELKKMVKK